MRPFFAVRRRYMKRVRAILRPYVPAQHRDLLRQVGQSSARALESCIATIVALLMKMLPDGVSVALREKLTLQRPLDYEDAVIHLRVTSRTEWDVRLRSCEKEPETVDWIQKTMAAGDVLYDIGANVGAYSLVAAHWTRGQALTYAFEPGYSTFANLVENIFMNRCEGSVIPFQLALGAETAVRGFQYASLEPGGATHGGITGAGDPGHHRTQALMCYRLDEFVSLFRLRPPTHLKIDVDGSELEILRGAPATMRSTSLEWVLVEVDVTSGQTAAVKELLEELGFSLAADHEHRGGITHNWIFRRTALPMAPQDGQHGAFTNAGSRPGVTVAAHTVDSYRVRSAP